MFKVEFKVVGLKEAKLSIKTLTESVRADLSAFGDETVNHFREVIKHSARRGSTGRLGSFITKEEGTNGTVDWVGIGSIPTLNTNVPYWSVVNYGGYVPPVNLGYFPGKTPPLFSFRGRGTEVWTHTGSKGDFLMKPNSPIRPMNYIEKTLGWAMTMYPSKFTKVRMNVA